MSRKRAHCDAPAAPADPASKKALLKLDKELLRAVQSRNVEKVRQLLADGANPNGVRDNKKGRSCLHWALCDADFPSVDAIDRIPNLESLPLTLEKVQLMSGRQRRVGLGKILNKLLRNLDIAKLLLQAGADPLAVDPHRNTCLHLAAAGDRDGLSIRLLLEQPGVPAILNTPNEFGYTPLLVFALHHEGEHYSDREWGLQLLVDAGADVSIAAANDGFTCLHLCVGRPDGLDLLRVFLDAPGAASIVNSVNCFGMTPLQIATEYSNIKAIEKMIELGADVNHSSPQAEQHCVGTPLHIAAWNGYNDKVKLLLKHGAKADAISSRGESVIFLAVKNRKRTEYKYGYGSSHTDMYRVLIKYGANVNEGGPRGYAPLKAVVEYGSVDEVQFFHDLIEQNVLNPLVDTSLLHAFFLKEDYSVLNYLLDNGLCEVDELDEKGSTVLYKVVSSSDRDFHRVHAVQRLLAAGADVNFKTDRSRSMLNIAISRQQRNIVKGLVKHISLLEMKSNRIDPEDSIAIENDDYAKHLYKDCKTELDLMSSVIVDGSITYFSILAQFSWIKNEKIVNILQTLDKDSMKQKFPIYHDLVFVTLKQNEIRHKMIGKAMKILKRIIRIDLDIYHIIGTKILRYLSNKDLCALRRVRT
ncbi:hypothetical protein QAD02_022131 [Eretmocerus hayati]|uniref:Uncharacterized protein n=1 Tax=Eretmocerus hayati TaxID=131215 RepID=A0ACC2PVF4_9HYME|nr:hypothetical protein QAD02_022131 [Eretmocerus hayati]